MRLIAESISRHYDRVSRDMSRSWFTAVEETSLTLEAGQLVALMGRSGSGKSTLINMLGGLLKPSGGTVRLDGQDLYALRDAELSALRNRHFGIIPQGQTGLRTLTVRENILLPAVLLGRPDDHADRAESLMERLGIAHLSDVHPDELSGGEMRRVAIARGLLLRPGIVLADEPTGDLDDATTEVVMKLLRETADAGAAVLMATHEEGAAAWSDRILRMDAGMLKEG